MFQQAFEDASAGIFADDEDADGVLEMRGCGDGGVGGLRDIVGVIVADEGGLDGSAASAELRGVEGGAGRGGREEGSCGRKEAGDGGGEAGSVGCATGEDDLRGLAGSVAGKWWVGKGEYFVDVDDVEIGLSNGFFDKAGEGPEDFAS